MNSKLKAAAIGIGFALIAIYLVNKVPAVGRLVGKA
jgi:hypothetical protein